MNIEYLRPPGNVSRHRQELLHDGDTVKVTLQPIPPGHGPLRLGGRSVPEGGVVLWFTFPGEWYEIAAAYDPEGRLLGWYTNIVRPPEIAALSWRIVDLFVDVWQDPSGDARLLDLAELDRARERGWIEPETAERAVAVARRVTESASAGRWPPRRVRRWGLDAVPSLRFQRDAPGIYFANLVSGRIIAFGIYTLGAVSLTSLAFAAFTDAFAGGRSGQAVWLVTIALEAAVLLPFALSGRLPATRIPRPREALSERTLFIGTLVMGVAVLLLHDSSLWRGGLLGVYSTLTLFLLVFAACRAAFDRSTPVLALAGLVVCAVALLVLL
ncbi:MAG: DUF402 domain-containing protein [Gemmatimonadota bacterium]